MLGFGFNKTKVLASAERYVQQGKLQAAIAEYEKVSKEDPKDITVLNTIGDLYARLGQVDSAVNYFRKVGDHYATEGFTVKAIAMYKKLTKLNPSALDSVHKLAELYTQQGLYNDARQQYMQVADSHIRANATDEACRVFQKMLELDPENSTLQAKLADLYIKIGKKDEAKDIFLRAAEGLYQRGNIDAANDALRKVITVDAGNVRALQLKGQIALNRGDASGAVAAFNKIPDLDSRPEALRSLLNAYVQLGSAEDVAPCAKKLLSVHQDISGIKTYADMLLAAGKINEAIAVYEEFSDKLIAANGPAVVQALNAYILKVKDDPNALDCLNSLFQKAGDNSHAAEIMELLAHACVQKGDLTRARDLYKELSVMEPENPLHTQNYKQILAKMGEETTLRELSPEEGSQALMVEELESSEITIEQHYPEALATAIQTALTEADLFESYNVPKKAMAPLEAILPRAPQDVRLNQRLAAMYARMGRPAEAAQRCAVLERVFSDAGMPKEAMRFGEMAGRYAETAGTAVPRVESAPAAEISAVPEASQPAFTVSAEPAPGKVEEFNFDSLPVEAAPAIPVEPPPPTSVTEFIHSTTNHTAIPFEITPPKMHVPVEIPPVEAPAVTAPKPAANTQEIDLSEEWDAMLEAQEEAIETPAEVEHAEPEITPEAEPVSTLAAPAVEVRAEPAVPEEIAAPSESDEALEEVKFYISESMWDEAKAAIEKFASLAPDHPELDALREQLLAAPSSEPTADLEIESLPEPEMVAAPEPQVAVESEPEPPPAIEPEVAEVQEEELLPVSDQEPVAVEAAQVELEPAGIEVEESPLAIEEPVATEPEPVSAAESDDVLGDFVSDLDASLGEDFSFGGKKPVPTPAPVPVPELPIPMPAVAASAPVISPEPVAVAQAVAAAPALQKIELEPEPVSEGTALLNDLFAEFKEDVEDGVTQDEDPETHYNLGVAFKEMGLLDEAIGELQKVCQSIEHGNPFSQKIQAYTWLANCFVEKGVPEASVKWYQKALTSAPDEDTRTAIHYELASAYESAGMKPDALRHFMEVYTTNIDFRDVAERIKALKQ